jgi:hypothetical protein
LSGGDAEALAGEAGCESAEGHLDARREPSRAIRFYAGLRNQTSRDVLLVVFDGHMRKRSPVPATVLKATYNHPYQYVMDRLGASCAVADVQGDKATLYSPSQGVWYQKDHWRYDSRASDQGTYMVIFRRGSGCYGLNGADTVSYDAWCFRRQWASRTRATQPQG